MQLGTGVGSNLSLRLPTTWNKSEPAAANWPGSNQTLQLSAWLGSNLSLELKSWLGSDQSLLLPVWLGSNLSLRLSTWLGTNLSLQLQTDLDQIRGNSCKPDLNQIRACGCQHALHTEVAHTQTHTHCSCNGGIVAVMAKVTGPSVHRGWTHRCVCAKRCRRGSNLPLIRRPSGGV